MKLIAFIASLFIRGLHATLRVRHVRVKNITDTARCIITFWHAHLLLMLHTKWHGDFTVIISQSKDGEYIARVFEWYGLDAVRGSSTRGGASALRQMIRIARAGRNLVFTPDGPKGPPRVVKDGVVLAARATGLPILPIAFAAKKKSFCGRGTGWSSPSRSRGRSSSTANRSSCRVTGTSKNGACESRSA
jgi:lysophospholipid acyltransferase (LPLAT)-like uncharacterized protein